MPDRLHQLQQLVLDSPLGPRLRTWRGVHQDRALNHGLHTAVVADALYRVLLGRKATRREMAEARRRIGPEFGVLELAQELKDTVDGSRRTVDSVGPALRTWLRSQFEPGATEFPSPRLVFLHFMKVGGTSLSARFADRLGEVRARVHLYLDDLAILPPPVLANAQVIAGHIPVAGLALVPGDFWTVTVLRDPLERTISHWSHMREVNPMHRDLTLEEFVFDEESSFSGNHQARYLAHDVDVAGAWRTYSPEERIAAIDGDRYTEHPLQVLFDIGGTGLTDEELLARAAANLRRIDFVGTTADLDRVDRATAGLFGWPSEPLARLNQSRPVDRGEISDRVRRKIDERTAVDRELYDLARELAEQLP